MVMVKVNVTGTVYEVDSDLFTGTKSTVNLEGKLPSLITEAAKTESTLTFQRPVNNFAAILEYYLTGELHMPNDVCPASFKKELDFWEIRETLLQECCRIKFRSFLEEQKLLSDFRKELSKNWVGQSVMKTSTQRQRIWNVVDNRSSSIRAKVYFAVTIIAVVSSILGITLGTDMCCMREATFCEMVEYVSYENKKLYESLKDHVDTSQCSNSIFSDDDDFELPPFVTLTEDKTYYFIRIDMDLGSTPVSPPGNGTKHPPPPPKDNDVFSFSVRKLYIRENWVYILEYITLAFFTFDFLVRVCTCPSILQFAKSVLNVIDFAALVGSFLSIGITSVYKQQKYQTNWIDMLDYIQVFRALRLFRLVKNIRTSQVLSFSMRRNTKDMSMLVIFLLIFISTFGTMIYFAEDSSTVGSILHGWWWSVVTLTTLGYGDIVPLTTMGRAIGSVCAVTGIWLLSMTLPIFVNDFVSLHQYPNYQDDVENDVDGVSNGGYKGETDIAHKRDDNFNTKHNKLSVIQPVYNENANNAWMLLPGRVE